MAAVAATLGLVSAAHAADLNQGLAVVPAAVPGYNWSGFYVGAQIGHAWSRDTTREYLTQTFTYVGLQNSYEPTGWFGGIHAGGNMQYGDFVAGVEADVELADIAGGFVDPPGPPPAFNPLGLPANPGGRGRTDVDWQGSLRGRLGYAFGNTLLYGTGGVAFMRHTSTYSNWPGVTEVFRRNRAGWTLGAGVEYAINNALTVRLEYRYTEFETFRNNLTVAFPGFTGTQEPVFHTVRTGLSFRF